MRVLLIGAGRMASAIAAYLSDPRFGRPADAITVADVRRDAASSLVERLEGRGASSSLSWIVLDASDRDAVAEAAAAAGADVVIDAALFDTIPASTLGALDAGANYLDLGSDRETLQWQISLSRDFAERGTVAVPGMGGSPGLINVLARAAADRLDSVSEMRMREGWRDFVDYDSLGVPLPVPYSLETILDEFESEAEVFSDGDVVKVPGMSGREVCEMPDPVGRVECYYVDHQEVWSVGVSLSDRGLRRVDYKLSFPRELYEKYRLLSDLGYGSAEPLDLDGQISPLRLLGVLVRENLSGKNWRPDDVDLMMVRAIGKSAGRDSRVDAFAEARSLEDPPISSHAVMVAAPASTAARWIVDGRLDARGVLLPEVFFDPGEFLGEVSSLGIRVWVDGPTSF